jgi:hypothetical protein
VYFPAVLSAGVDLLANRLGERATLADPLFGKATGTAGLAAALHSIAAWLSERSARFESERLIIGSDREVAEGRLSLDVSGKTVMLPVAVVAEKRREREIDLRVYYSTHALGDSAPRQESIVEQDVVLPPPVATHLDALSRADFQGVLASFERNAVLRAPDGRVYGGDAAGPPLNVFFEALVSSNEGAKGGTRFVKTARADDGNACAVECALVRLRGREVAPRPSLIVFERGDSGLLKGARIYGDVG